MVLKCARLDPVLMSQGSDSCGAAGRYQEVEQCRTSSEQTEQPREGGRAGRRVSRNTEAQCDRVVSLIAR